MKPTHFIIFHKQDLTQAINLDRLKVAFCGSYEEMRTKFYEYAKKAYLLSLNGDATNYRSTITRDGVLKESFVRGNVQMTFYLADRKTAAELLI